MVKTTKIAETLLANLPLEHNYTFLVLQNLTNEPEILLKRARNRNLVFPVQFLSKKVHRIVANCISSLLRNQVFVNEPCTIEQLVNLQRAINYTVHNTEQSHVSGGGAITGGYTRTPLSLSRLKEVIEVKIQIEKQKNNLQESQTQLEQLKAQSNKARAELLFTMNEYTYPLTVDFSEQWNTFLVDKERYTKLRRSLTSSKLRLESTQNLVQLFQSFIADQENLAAFEDVNDLYAKKRELKLKMKDLRTSMGAQRDNENKMYKDFVKTLTDLKEIERSLDVSKYIPLAQCYKRLNVLIVQESQKINDTIMEAQNTMEDLSTQYARELTETQSPPAQTRRNHIERLKISRLEQSLLLKEFFEVGFYYSQNFVNFKKVSSKMLTE